ncbi:MAG: Dabb family protein [Clostridia bacterium]|nr:Dabb family protein [Clostridia bacterium]
MVKHIVMFKFLESAQGRTKKENAQIAADMLINLQGKVPTLLSSEVKLNSVNADATNYDLILISDFNSWEDLQEYIVHPLHKAVGEFMKPVRESRSCVDYEY